MSYYECAICNNAADKIFKSLSLMNKVDSKGQTIEDSSPSALFRLTARNNRVNITYHRTEDNAYDVFYLCSKEYCRELINTLN